MKSFPLVLGFAALVTMSPAFAQISSSRKSVQPASPTSALEAKIAALEKESWDAAKRHDVASYAALCRNDGWEIFGDGTLHTMKEVIADMPDTTVADYKTDDVQVFVLRTETAIVRYKIWARVAVKGKETPPQWMFASCVYTKVGNNWKAAMYQETPLPAAEAKLN